MHLAIRSAGMIAATFFITDPAFCTADGGPVKDKTQMSSKAQPARMGDALAVNQEYIGAGLELLSCFDADGGLSK